MKQRKLERLNMAGSSHLIALLLVVVGVGIFGTYTIVSSHAQVPPPDPTPVSWHTVKSASVNWSPEKQNTPNFTLALTAGKKYRWCMTFKTAAFQQWNGRSGGIIDMQTYPSGYVNYNLGAYYTAGTYSRCTPTIVPSSNVSSERITVYASGIPSLTVTSLSWQRYY